MNDPFVIHVLQSSSQGMLTLDLVEEEELHPGGAEVKGRQRSGTDASQLRPSPRGPATGSLPRGSERCWGRPRPEAPQTSRTSRPPHAQVRGSSSPVLLVWDHLAPCC